MKIKRKYSIGAEIIPKKGVHFRVWAPDHTQVQLILENEGKDPKYYSLKNEKNGYFSKLITECKEGSLYRYKLGDKKDWLADPASRFQPQGPMGPSCVIDSHFDWTDGKWKGVNMKGNIIYEIHIGTFTPEGTFKSAEAKLSELAHLGITLIELMPINDFPGRFGWGYDGVNQFAPCRLYGSPNDVKSFVNKAHQLGLGVVLDVVYNHLGPEGNQLHFFSKKYFSKKHTTNWGDAINFDEPQVREFFLTNCRYWIEEFHFDGLRIDATPWFFCSYSPHILAELTRTIKKSGGKKQTVAIGENEPQITKLLLPYKKKGHGFDALWNDDFHHSALVRLTGKREAYYTDYLGSPQEFISALKYGFLYQGQYYAWQKQVRGTPNLNLSPHQLIIFLENHDQIANSAQGKRLNQLCDRGNYKALTCLLLLSPNTPMLFQGQEFGSTQPFHYFADHHKDLSKLIRKGRKAELSQFPRLATQEVAQKIHDPSKIETFNESKLNYKDKELNIKLYNLHRDLIKIRKTDPVFKNVQTIRYEGAVLGTDSFLIRYFGGKSGDRLLIINFGPDHYFTPGPEPLLVAGENLEWEILWSSESVIYEGDGTPPINIPFWKILGHSAIVLKTIKKAQ